MAQAGISNSHSDSEDLENQDAADRTARATAVSGAVWTAYRHPVVIRAGTMTELPALQEGLSIPDMPDALVGDGCVDDRIGDRLVPHEGLQPCGNFFRTSLKGKRRKTMVDLQ